MVEIFCKEGLNLQGKTYYREAVRGIVWDEDKILLIYSEKNGDYKLPGGGIEEGENYIDALIREVQEESGYMVEVLDEVLQVMEYDEGQFDDCDIFKMLSRYFNCTVLQELEQDLDSYELEMGFIPVWTQIDEAIEANKKVMEKTEFPRWTKRETEVLEYLKKQMVLKR